MTTMRAAIFQARSAGQSLAKRLGELEKNLARDNLDLLVCPELYLSGYNVGDTLSLLAQPVDGEHVQQIAALAIKYQCAIVYGYPERAHDGGLFNAAACVDKAGENIAHHRKLMIPPGFEQDVFDSGSKLTLFQLGEFKCALLICYDAEYPEAVRAAAQTGAQVIIVPTALSENWGSVATQMMPTRAFENGVWFLYANHAGEENGLRYYGGSCIVTPDGTDAARAGAQEELIIAELDLTQVTTAQNRLPYLRGAEQLDLKSS
ncbi:MAG: putative amidohydrolase [Saprospiraceae bacterium]|jgi:predicted amidohydrolase